MLAAFYVQFKATTPATRPIHIYTHVQYSKQLVTVSITYDPVTHKLSSHDLTHYLWPMTSNWNCSTNVFIAVMFLSAHSNQRRLLLQQDQSGLRGAFLMMWLFTADLSEQPIMKNASTGCWGKTLLMSGLPLSRQKTIRLFHMKLQTTYSTDPHLLIQNPLVTKFRSCFSNWLTSTQNAEHQICKKN